MDFRSRSRSGSRSRSRSRERKRRGYYRKREPKERIDYDIEDLRQENDYLRKRLEMLEMNQEVKVRFSRGFQTEDVQLITRSTSPNFFQQNQIEQGSQTDTDFKALDGILEIWKNYSTNTDASTNTDELPKEMEIKVCNTREVGVGTETEEINLNLVNMENGKIVNKNVFQPQQGRAVEVTEKVRQTNEIEKDEQRDRDRRHGQGHRNMLDKNQLTPATQQVQNRYSNNGLSRGPSAEVIPERKESNTTGYFIGLGGMAKNPIFSPNSHSSTSREAMHNAGEETQVTKGTQVSTEAAETGKKEQGDRDRRQSHVKNGEFQRNILDKSQPTTAPQQVQNRSPEPASTYRIPKYNNANANRDSRGRSESEGTEDNGRRGNSNSTDWPIIVSTRSLSFSEEILKQMELAETANHKKNSASALSGSGADVHLNKQDQAREGNSNAENIKNYNQNSPNKAETTRRYESQKKGPIKEERNNFPSTSLFKCSVEACERIFVHESQLLFHNQQRHSNGEKKLLCFYCKKKFRVEDRFNNHVKKRLGTYQKGCWRCKKGFSCQENWRIHNDMHLNRILKTSC